VQPSEANYRLPLIMVSELSRLELAVTHLLYRPAKRRSVAMVLGPEELPAGEWFAGREVAWRMGAVGFPSEQGHRAWIAGAVTAARTFNDISSSRRLILQVLPYTSELDAAVAAPNLPLRMGSNGTAGEWKIDVPENPGLVGALACERVIDGTGGLKKQKVIVGSVGPIAFVTASFQADDPNWDEVTDVAALQSKKIRSCLESEVPGGQD